MVLGLLLCGGFLPQSASGQTLISFNGSADRIKEAPPSTSAAVHVWGEFCLAKIVPLNLDAPGVIVRVNKLLDMPPELVSGVPFFLTIPQSLKPKATPTHAEFACVPGNPSCKMIIDTRGEECTDAGTPGKIFNFDLAETKVEAR
jgi:hypothetical protein